MIMRFLLLSMQTGFSWFHLPPISHWSISGPSSQYPSLHVYFKVDVHVNGAVPSISPFSIDPGFAQCRAEGKVENKLVCVHLTHLWKQISQSWRLFLQIIMYQLAFLLLTRMPFSRKRTICVSIDHIKALTVDRKLISFNFTLALSNLDLCMAVLYVYIWGEYKPTKVKVW